MREPGKGFLTSVDQEDGDEGMKKLKLGLPNPHPGGQRAVGQLSWASQGVKGVAERHCEDF